MKVLKYCLEHKTLCLSLILGLIITFLSFQIFNLQNKIVKISEEKDSFKDKIELLDIKIDSIQKEIVVKENIIKDKEVKISKLNNKIIVIHEKYEEKYRDIDNFNNAQLINELSIIFSKNNIN